MFTPIVPLGGYLGWQFLQRTQENQQEALANSATVQRDMAEFEERIAKVKTPEDLVSDFRLLRVALGAFGLSDDIDNKYFIRKVLEEGTTDERALANRLSDTRYHDLAKAFGFGEYQTPNNGFSAIEDQIRAGTDTLPPRARQAAGDKAMELVYTLDDLTTLMAAEERDPAGEAALRKEIDGLWSDVMGNPRLRASVLSAFNVAEGFDALPGATQVEVLRQRIVGLFEGRPAEQMTGFIDTIKSAYTTRQFELGVGEQAQELRVALNFEREMPGLAADPDDANDTMWFKVMGTSALREVFDTAFGLPDAFPALDLDRQLEVYKQRAQALFGSDDVSQFTDPEAREELIRLYLVRTELNGGASTGGGTSAALQILSGVSSGSLFTTLLR
ncbi:DUF1217 domain-containing protein [Vannielia litorea]|uniref:DUF1217 domain-containing protein n=1 Tax=Vannielia litorea TaxID=1217970 RepID=UPI001C96FACA|nr:DUF1217 domain-containing protein [Vannielia litorea]MBY6049936.1 DUF1217 domain-containing protein [Vannielia litorea]MBY6077350.1 DUF1217 domain-containing protein [Vannielia litorea]